MSTGADSEEYLRPPTPPIDPTVAELSSRAQISSSASKDRRNGEEANSDEELSDSDLFAELEKDDDVMLAGLREQRLEALKAEMSRARNLREQEHGRYTEITDEKEVIKTSAQEGRCVIHFYHRDFRRCQIMDKHLEAIAPHHFKTRFFRVFVENVPWLVDRLQIKVLPDVMCFIGGVQKDRLIGFEEIGNDDAFTTAALELRLSQSGVIDPPGKKINQLVTKYSSTGPSIRDREAQDEADWDSDE